MHAVRAWHEFHRLRGAQAKADAPVALTMDGVRQLLSTGSVGERTVLSESESARVLQACGVPVVTGTTVTDRQAAMAAARRAGHPVVLKVDSPDIPHKTEAGAVRLGLRSDEDVGNAFDEVMRNARAYAPDANILGVSVQPMVSKDFELFVGARQDPLFGPVVVVGLGGIFVEVLQDTVVDLAPVTPAHAREMLSRLRGRRLLEGFRGAAAADLDELSTLISRVSHLIAAHADRIEEVDVNPLAISNGKAMALDALVILRPNAAG